MSRFTGMHREGDVEHNHFADGTVVSVRRDWTPGDAAEGLVRDWLSPVVQNGGDEIADTHVRAWRQPRYIRDENRKRLGVLVSAEDYDEGQAAIHRINQDAYGQSDNGYKPFQHSPLATTDRIINTDTLEDVIRRLIDAEEKPTVDQIHYAALVAALEFAFDPDSRGIVPVMTPGRPTDSLHSEYYWSFLYPTSVPGLYLRPDDDIIGATAYTITTGAGWALVGGFYERDYAEELAVKLHEATPGQDWFRLAQGDLTTELRETYVALIKAHGRWRPEPVAPVSFVPLPGMEDTAT